MASQVPPKKNAAHTFYLSLGSQSSAYTFQTNPTLAAGDVKVSTDGAAFTNIATLPVVTPSGGKAVKVDLSASEMNGDNIQVLFSDAAGAEWADVLINIQTSTRQLDDLAYPATSGRSLAVDASGQVTTGALAADAVNAAAVAASAVAEIQSGLMLAASYTAPDNTSIAAIKAKTDNLPASPAATSDIPSAAANAAALLDSADGVETGLTPRGALRLIAAALSGVLAGAGTGTVTFKNAVANSKTRITATTDEVGNRNVVNTDVS